MARIALLENRCFDNSR